MLHGVVIYSLQSYFIRIMRDRLLKNERAYTTFFTYQKYYLEPWPNGLVSHASRRKFARTDLAYGLAKGGVDLRAVLARA